MTKAEMESLLELPVSERVELTELLWKSLEREPDALLTESDKTVLRRRLQEFERNPEGGIPWEEVKAELWPEE